MLYSNVFMLIETKMLVYELSISRIFTRIYSNKDISIDNAFESVFLCERNWVSKC